LIASLLRRTKNIDPDAGTIRHVLPATFAMKTDTGRK